jgi:hypothetical protein
MVVEVAFSAGASDLTVFEKHVVSQDGSERIKEIVELDCGTSIAKTFLDLLTSKPFFNRDEFSIAIRQPRSLVSQGNLSMLTRPLVEPATDVFEELWQFSQITYGFVGRILIGAVLLAYGLVQYQLLLIVAGLLFIPLLPLMLSAGFGLWTRQWRLVAQGLLALGIALLLLTLGGVLVALLTSPPVRFTEFNSLMTGVLLSAVVGVAGGLATTDDVGRREMIGLAATAQVAIIPAWIGLCLIHGFPLLGDRPALRLIGLLLNIAAIIVLSLLTYAALRIRAATLRCFKDAPD